MRTLAGRLLLVIGCSVLGLSARALFMWQQQVVDETFKASVEQPAYTQSGPTVAIDEAHGNFHTASGQYKPLADLLTADGYRVVASTSKFETGSLAGVAVLVISNARNMEAILAGDISQPAFTDHESDVIQDWVRDGGSLLLIADHAPFGNATERLSQRFGVNMSKGWTFDATSSGEITTQLDFSLQNGLLGDHAILQGRRPSEKISHIRSFTGQSLSVPPGATILMRLSSTARDAATPSDLDAEGLAAQRGESSSRGTHSTPAFGRAQGLAMPFGRGRIVFLGEAGLLSAQVVRNPDGTEMRFGMNLPGTDDRQFALNVLHWLSQLLN